MTRQLLVPLDGTPLAETALPLAGVLAGVLDAGLDLVRVVPPDAEPSMAACAQTYLTRVASELAGSAIECGTRVLTGDPGKCIVREATAAHVAAVVMCTHARSGMGRAVLGSVAANVVAQCPAPTVLTRADIPARPRLQTLLVAIDATCAAPLSAVVELAQHHALQVVLLRVVSPDDLSIWQWQRGPTLDEPQAVLMARQQLDDVASRLRAKGINAQAHVEVGAAVPCIGAVAERIDADLIVMASHARTGAQRAIHGSAADAVMRTARRPVMVCRLVPPPPGMPDARRLAHAIQYVPPPLVPQTIPELNPTGWCAATTDPVGR